MIKKKVYLKSLDVAHVFVDAMSKVTSEVDIKSGRYVVNAKSILGVLSLDISQKLDVEFHSDSKDEITYFNNLILPFETHD